MAYYCARRVGRIYTTTSGVEGLQSRIKNSDQKIFDLGDLESPKVLIPGGWFLAAAELILRATPPHRPR